jgi:hypothetical protein
MEMKGHYRHLFMMLGLSFVAMYGLMYAMVNSLGNAYANINQVYMAGLMTAPMALLELWIMRSMYTNKRWNAAIAATGAITGMLCWILIRQQAAVTDTQFLRSMIPHHGGAILMCEEAQLRDASIRELCKSIITSQQAEIDQMKRLLAGR